MNFSKIILALTFFSSMAMAHENGTIRIYDAQDVGMVSKYNFGKLIMKDGEKLTLFTKENAVVLNRNLERTRDYFADEFSMKSWNNRRAPILASINFGKNTIFDLSGKKTTAAWNGTSFIFGSGYKNGIGNFESALDVVAHEYTHAIIQETSKLVYRGQSGALNEHLADVFGSILNQVYYPKSNPYLIGTKAITGSLGKNVRALRDMMEPSKSYYPQPAHMKELGKEPYSQYGAKCVPAAVNDHCGVHVLSGIPNKMAALVMSAIGTRESAKLFFNVMTKRLKANSNFVDYRKALMTECRSMSSDTCDIVDDALKSVGM